MNVDKIARVLRIAREFERRSQVTIRDAAESGTFITGTAASGALRRTSMELTRALADLRRSG